jgi:dihydrofolate synthase/folylpolyglutamate synthase
MVLDKQALINQLLDTEDFHTDLLPIKAIIEDLHLYPSYPIILVGGTNGKGSTCAYLTTILTLAGYKVGGFISPHVLSYNERITLDNQAVDDATLTKALAKVMKASQSKFGRNFGLFKTFALAAQQIFLQQGVDIAIIEVGIGGRLDVTNLFEPTISAVTNVDYDHCKILGDSLEQIGWEKAGIFRSQQWCFFGSPNIPDSVTNYATQIKARLQVAGTDFGIVKHELSFDVWCQERKFYSLPYPALRGKEQVHNVALAVAILSKLHERFPISLATIKTGLLQTCLIGRFQILPGLPQVVLDVAHNPQAVSAMLQNMLQLPFAKNDYAVVGIANDKDIAQIIQLCRHSFKTWFIAPINSPRSIAINKLTHLLLAQGIATENIIQCESIAAAYQAAKKKATIEDRITCFGSFLVVEQTYAAIHNLR